MSLIAELQRRNVIKVAIAYLAAAWLLIQVADTLLPVYGTSDTAMRILVGALVVGFIPAVIAAWVFELTPEGLKRESEVDRSESITLETGKKLDRGIIVVLSIALAYFAFDKLVLSEARIETAREEGRSDALVESFGNKSIAVLPFVDMSVAGDQEYMGDGIAEELLNLLTQVQELRVISRSSAFTFKNKDVDIPTIAERLGVDHVLEGSVRKAGDTIRITAQLIEARSDTHLWSASYDRKLTDIFAIQDEIAEQVVDELKITLLGSTPIVSKTDPAAYDMFLQARFYHESPSSPENMRKALDLYQASLEIDEYYVPAWAWLAAAYADSTAVGVVSFSDVYTLVMESAEKAIELGPDDALANATYGLVLNLVGGDLEGSFQYVQRAVELDPSNPYVLRLAGFGLQYLGRFDEANRVREFLFDRDPLGLLARRHLAMSYLASGRLAEASEVSRSSLELFPTDIGFQVVLATVASAEGDGQAALAHAEKIHAPEMQLMFRAIGYQLLGRQAEFEDAFGKLETLTLEGKAQSRAIPIVCTMIGDADCAFEWIQQGLESGRLPKTHFVPGDVTWRNLFDDPRWDVLLESIGRSREALDAVEFEVRLP